MGGLFRGIETKWQTIDPTLAWIEQLKSATQSSEVTSFVQSSIRDAEKLRNGVKAIEILAQLVEQNRQELSGIVPLSLFAAEPQAVKLHELCGVLSRTETMVKALADRIQAQVKVQPRATCAELAERIGQLDKLQQLDLALRQHSGIADPVAAASLRTGALGEDVVWLAELEKYNVTRKLVDAIIGRKLELEKHLPLIHAAKSFSQQIARLNEVFLKQKTAAWISGDVSTVELGSKMALLIQTINSFRTQATEWTFDNHLNILEIRESLDDAHEIEAATKTFVNWRDILHEEPSLLSAEQITTTLDWLDALRQHGATGGLLHWILTDETDNRLHWWQQLVSRAQDLRGRVRKLQDSFALPLQDTQPTMTLVAWSSQTADRNAKMTSALEIVESHIRCGEGMFCVFALK